MGKKYIGVEDLSAYRRSFALSNYVWNLVFQWKYFEKNTVGKQFVRAVDSISANIAEGFNRYHRKDKVLFYYFAKGSVGESQDWLEKCRARKLINEDNYVYILGELEEFPKEIHTLIQFTYTKLKR